MSGFARVIHLSDFHFGRKLNQNGRAFHQEVFLFAKAKPHAYDKLTSLGRKVHEIQLQQGEFDVLLGTGDLSTDGSETALKLCLSFIQDRLVGDEMRSELRGLGVNAERRILVPGNHDRFDRAWIGFQKPGKAFETLLETRTPYPYVVGCRRSGTPNVPENPAVLFFVFDSTPSRHANLSPWNRIARGRLSDGDCESFVEKVQELTPSGIVAALDGSELNVNYANCVRIAVLHHHPLDDNSTTLMENSELFMKNCVKLGMHLVLFGHDHREFWHLREGFAQPTNDLGHHTLFFCCPSASEYSSKNGFYTFDLDTTGFLFDFYKWDERAKAFVVGGLNEENRFVRDELYRFPFSHPLRVMI